MRAFTRKTKTEGQQDNGITFCSIKYIAYSVQSFYDVLTYDFNLHNSTAYF
jgi:hypothetical protein